MLRPVKALLRDDGFWVAMVAGALGAAFVALAVRRFTARVGYAFVAVVATVLGFRVEHRLGAPLVVALVLLGLGEWFASDTGSSGARFAFGVPGALVLAASLPHGFGFDLRVAVVVAAAVLGPFAVVGARRDPRLVAVLFAIAGVGIYACVPDTEHAKALLGALLAAALVAVDRRLPATLGVGALTGLVVWTVAFDGHGRPGSVVGGLACLGVIVLLPLAGWGWRGRGPAGVAIGVQVVVVAYESRVAGFEQTAAMAGLLALPVLVLAWGVLAFVVRQRRASSR